MDDRLEQNKKDVMGFGMGTTCFLSFGFLWICFVSSFVVL